MIEFNRRLILASASPRRQSLMREAGFTFEVRVPDVDERFPPDMAVTEVAAFIAKRKADSFRGRPDDDIIVTADTVVILADRILNKPDTRDEAIRMLGELSGRSHLVMTGVCILSNEKECLFDDTTEVTFKKLTRDEIEFYVDRYQPFDKAGGYGAQDWIGMVAIEKIAGSYFNVMGLPIHKVYENLSRWATASTR